MPDNRTFAGSQATVTVGLVDGQSKTGSIGAFEPAFDEIVMKVSSRNMDGSIDRIGVHVPRERVSYVAFYRDTHAVVPPEANTLGETRIYAPGGNTFSVRVRLDALGDPVGFYGYPVSRASLYSEVFFFADGINAVEDATPLGELLVQEGLVDNDALREGCLAQAAGRESPIGQILVEQEVIEPEQVEQAAADQGGRLRSGKPQRLGEILVEAGLATAAQIEQALSEQRQRRGKRLGEVLVELGIVAEEVIARTLARKFHVPYVDLDSYDVDPEAAGAIPVGIIERFGVLPVRVDDRTLTIAMSDPTAIEALDMLRFSLDRKLSEVVV
ncbi:MAG: hypothetical protein QGH45_07540, partial [Myxococcota bacterium]|nr:hypothetical protein [Myxococcota bacterium]